MTASSQTINTEEISNRILQDSVSYSWKQANEFVNGLENEKRLDSVYRILVRENISLSKSYQSLEKRFINYRDTIVPAYEQVIQNKDANFEQLNNVHKSSEKLLKKQRLKKWIWLVGAVIGGYVIGSI